MKKSVIQEVLLQYYVHEDFEDVEITGFFKSMLQRPEVRCLKDDEPLPATIINEILGLRPIYEQACNIVQELKTRIFIEKDWTLAFDNLSKGDWVYGFREIRSALMRLLNKRTPTFNVSIDALNNIETKVHNSKGSLTFDLLAQNSDEKPELVNQAKNFYYFALRFKEDGDSAYNRFLAHGGSERHEFVKKRCKLAILWGLNEGHKIHFLLDNFNEHTCFAKSLEKYTYSELRFIYRNWPSLKPFYDANRIIFYAFKNDVLVQVPPPWEGNPTPGTLYRPRNSRKEIYENFIAEMSTRVLAGNKPKEIGRLSLFNTSQNQSEEESNHDGISLDQ